MRVVKIKTNNMCSMPLCNKKADYVITSQSGRGGIYICDKCAKNLYNCLAKLYVPKGIENVIVRANKRRNFDE